jgi:hypothetical protein
LEALTFNPQEWHNIASGRLFILGNGPSLLTQMSLLQELANEATMTCNGMPRWKQLPFEPTYHTATDIPFHQWLDNIKAPHWKDTVRFACQRIGQEEHEDFYTVPMAHDGIQVHSFGMACMNGKWEGMRTARTTPLTVVQLGWWMGYREFYMMGIEQTRGYAWNPAAVMGHNNRAAFSIDKNPKYLLGIQKCARQIVTDIEANGGKIYDCTPDGFLNDNCSYRQTVNSVAQHNILEYRNLSEVLHGAVLAS